jgi:hypothetical protein
METLQTLLLEAPLPIYIGLAVLELVLGIVWFGRRDPRTLRQLLIPPAVAGVIFLVSWLVVTDREQIQTACRDIAVRAANGDVDGVAGHLHPQFEAEVRGRRVNKAIALNMARAALRNNQIVRVRFTQVEIEIEDGRASVFVTVVADTAGQQRYILSMDTRWTDESGPWTIRRAENVRFGWQ